MSLPTHYTVEIKQVETETYDYSGETRTRENHERLFFAEVPDTVVNEIIREVLRLNEAYKL